MAVTNKRSIAWLLNHYDELLEEKDNILSSSLKITEILRFTSVPNNRNICMKYYILYLFIYFTDMLLYI
jgi:hypothetical protein